MKQSPIELLVGLVLPIVAVVLLDLVVVPLDSDIASVAAGVVWLAALFATPVLFFRFFRRVLPEGRPDARPGLVVPCTTIALPPWFYVALTVLANIHSALGGSL